MIKNLFLFTNKKFFFKDTKFFEDKWVNEILENTLTFYNKKPKKKYI